MAPSVKEAIFLSSNDFLSKLYPFQPFIPDEQAPSTRGGMARIAAVIGQQQAAAPGKVLAVMAGLDLKGPTFDFFDGALEIKAMAAAGFCAAVPGIHEFESGAEKAGRAFYSASFPVLAANLSSVDPALENAFSDHVIFKTSRAKVGIFGLAMIGPGAKTRPDPMVTQKDSFEACARRQVEILQAKGCDIIAAVTHIGTTEDCRIAAAVPGLHAIFGGHSHKPTRDPQIIASADGSKTLVTQAGTGGALLGRLHIFVQNGLVDTSRTKWDLMPVDETISPEPALENDLFQAHQKLRVCLEKNAGYLPIAVDSQRQALFEGRSTLAKLVADALRIITNADTAIISAGDIKADLYLPPGPIDWKTIYQILPFGDAVCIFELTGKQLLDVLTLSGQARGASARQVDPCQLWQGSILHCSGIYASYDNCGKPADVLTGPDEKNRRPLDMSKTYRVACTSFYTHGGYGYDTLAKAPYYSAGINDSQCLAAYLNSFNPGGHHQFPSSES